MKRYFQLVKLFVYIRWETKEYCPTEKDNVCEMFKCDLGERIYLASLLHEMCNKSKLKVVSKEQTKKNLGIESEHIRLPEYIKPESYELWMHIMEEPTISGNVSISLKVVR